MDTRKMRIAVVVVTTIAITLTVGVVVVVIRDVHVPTSWVHAGTLEQVRERQVVAVESARAFVVATNQGPVTALYARSPDLGERVRYCRTSGWFEEARHGSLFDSLGRYVAGPAPRGLDRFAVNVVDGDVWIDTSSITLGPPRGRHDEPPTTLRCS